MNKIKAYLIYLCFCLHFHLSLRRQCRMPAYDYLLIISDIWQLPKKATFTSVHATLNCMRLLLVVGTWQAQRRATFTNVHAPTTNSTWKPTQDTRSVYVIMFICFTFPKNDHTCWRHSNLCMSQNHTEQAPWFTITVRWNTFIAKFWGSPLKKGKADEHVDISRYFGKGKADERVDISRYSL